MWFHGDKNDVGWNHPLARRRAASDWMFRFQTRPASLIVSFALFLHRPVTNRRTFHSLSVPMSSWSCKKCTFLNPPSQNTACKICQSPSSPPPPSPSSAPKWSCKACTFLNPYKNSDCELCGTRAPALSLSSFKDLIEISVDEDADSSVGSVFFPLQPCKKRKLDDPFPVVGNSDSAELGAFRDIKASGKAVAEMGLFSFTVSALVLSFLNQGICLILGVWQGILVLGQVWHQSRFWVTMSGSEKTWRCIIEWELLDNLSNGIHRMLFAFRFSILSLSF